MQVARGSREGRSGSQNLNPGAGPQTLPREIIERHQRQRIVEAAAQIAHEKGICEVTPTQLCKTGRMSRNKFYELFDSKKGCLRYSFQVASDIPIGPVRAAGQRDEPWLERVDAAVEGFFAAIIEEPLLAELCLVHSLTAPVESEGYGFEAGVEAMTEVLGGGRDAGRLARGEKYSEPPPRVEEFLARGIVSLASLRIRQGEAKELPAHRDELVQLAATPFFGIEDTSRLRRNLTVA